MKKSDIKPTETTKPSTSITSVKSPVASEPPRKDLCCDEDHVVLDDIETIEKSEEGDGIPDIVKTLVYYGLGEGKKPDPNRILFYERPDGSCIDVTGGTILPTRPSVLDHLPSRSITTDERDVVSAIINGAMSEPDFNILSENGMIGDLPKRLWEKTQLLKSQNAALAKVQELAKSDSSEESEDSDDESAESQDESKEETEPKEDENQETESEDSVDDQLKDVKEELGDDVFQEIMDLAMAKAINAVGGDSPEGLEGKIRAIVQDALEKMFGDEEPSQEQPDDDTPEEEPEAKEVEDDQGN